MNTNMSKGNFSTAGRHFDGFAIGLLIVHFYAVCYLAFQPQGVVGNITDKLYDLCTKLPIISDGTKTKLLILALTLIGAFLTARPAQRKIGYAFPLIMLSCGLWFFFSTYILTPVGYFRIVAYTYSGFTIFGYLLIIAGSGRLARATKYVFHTKLFHQETSGFKQMERRISKAYSLNFRARYQYNGRRRKSYINIINPRRGVLIMGSPGSGKSWFIIEPAIEQLTQKGMAMLVYDFKYPSLTQHTYNCFKKNVQKYPDTARFYSINFTDLSHSHRCNVIDPNTLKYSSDAVAISKTILLSMNKLLVSKQGEFFIESAISYLAALIWFLKQYKSGIYCTLPHVIELSKVPYDELFTILNVESSTRGLASPFKDAYINNTMEMLDGQTASARMPLTRLDSPDIYYLLSGNDLDLEINKTSKPAILCLGSDSQRHEALTPILSLYIDRVNRLINHPKGHPVALVIDEFATVRATSMLDTIATGRSNNIISILAIQDISQLKQRYSHDEADQIMNTAGNIICGQTTGESARWVSERFHTNLGLKTTISVNSSDISTSKTAQMMESVSPSVLANLSSGEFVGLVADDPDRKIKLKGFHASIQKGRALQENDIELPFVRQVDKATIEGNYELIGLQIADLVKDEMKRILGDPQLRKWIVKRR